MNIKQFFLFLKTPVFVISAMWFSYILNNVFKIPLDSLFSIIPRSFSLHSIIGIFTSWLSHFDFNHLIGNSISLFPVLICICLFERRPNFIIGMLIFLSGLSTWLLGSSYSVHVGASGLFFASVSFIITSIVVNRRIVYLIPVILSLIFYGADYYYSLANGIIPKDGISFAAHFGGVISGIFFCIFKKNFNI